MKKYYVLLDNLARVIVILHTDNKDAWVKYDNGNLAEVKRFVKKERVELFLDSKNVNGSSIHFDKYLV